MVKLSVVSTSIHWPALSVIEALSPLMRVRPEMKQPNDVVVREDNGMRKLAGCLTEVTVAGNRITQVRYGIGIDLWHAPELDASAQLRTCCVREYLLDGQADKAWAVLYHAVLFSLLGLISRGVELLSRGDHERGIG